MSNEIGTNFYSNCERALKEAAKQKAAQISHGLAESYSDYQRECGIIVGLNDALIIIEEVLKQMSKEDKNGN